MNRQLRKCESLSRAQRALTPLPFARLLVQRVRLLTGAQRIAVLWTHSSSFYQMLWPGVECWGPGKDANKYAGPWPIIAHPPCGPWGKYRSHCRQSRADGIRAMELVHRWGGVVEQPVGSSLFREYGGAGWITEVNQGDWGHRALKPTLLYWVNEPTGPEIASLIVDGQVSETDASQPGSTEREGVARGE